MNLGLDQLQDSQMHKKMKTLKAHLQKMIYLLQIKCITLLFNNYAYCLFPQLWVFTIVVCRFDSNISSTSSEDEEDEESSAVSGEDDEAREKRREEKREQKEKAKQEKKEKKEKKKKKVKTVVGSGL